MNILIYGLPTSGKTTFAEKLVKKIGTNIIRHINADKVREANNKLESAVYEMEEVFEDRVRDLRLAIDDLQLDIEDIEGR